MSAPLHQPSPPRPPPPSLRLRFPLRLLEQPAIRPLTRYLSLLHLLARPLMAHPSSMSPALPAPTTRPLVSALTIQRQASHMPPRSLASKTSSADSKKLGQVPSMGLTTRGPLHPQRTSSRFDIPPGRHLVPRLLVRLHTATPTCVHSLRGTRSPGRVFPTQTVYATPLEAHPCRLLPARSNHMLIGRIAPSRTPQRGPLH